MGPLQLAKADELVSLSERMHYMQMFRGVLALVVAIAGTVGRAAVGAEGSELVVAAAGYAALSVGVEAIRMLERRRGLLFVGAGFLLDGIFLAWVMYATGGTASPLRFLVYLHLVAATLVASYRTGLKVALWHSLLYFVVYFAQAAEILRPLDDSLARFGVSGAQFERTSVLNVTALWLVAIGTAGFSALNERDLRRQKAELAALAAMAADVERVSEPETVGTSLLDRILTVLPYERGAVFALEDGALTVLGSTDKLSPSVPVEPDDLIKETWTKHRAVLVRSVNPEENPALAQVMPGARNVLVVPMFAEGEPLGAVVLEKGGDVGSRVQRRTVSMLGQFAAHAGLVLRNARLMKQVQRMAETDPLTGLANRRTFQAALESEVERSKRQGEPVTLLMIDLDHFKSLNDNYGHQTGDEILKAAAAALREGCRPFDIAARYGGEEFAVILPACTSRESLQVADRVRESLSTMATLVPVTASAGVATYPTHAADAESLVRHADEALYESKRMGRDRVTRSRRRASRKKAQPAVTYL